MLRAEPHGFGPRIPVASPSLLPTSHNGVSRKPERSTCPIRRLYVQVDRFLMADQATKWQDLGQVSAMAILRQQPSGLVSRADPKSQLEPIWAADSTALPIPEIVAKGKHKGVECRLLAAVRTSVCVLKGESLHYANA